MCEPEKDFAWKMSVWFTVWPASISVWSSIWPAVTLFCSTLRDRSGVSVRVTDLTCASTADEISIDRPPSRYIRCWTECWFVSFRRLSLNFSCWTRNLIQHGKYHRTIRLDWLCDDSMNVWFEMFFLYILTRLFRYRFARLASRPRNNHTNISPGWNVRKINI